MKKYKQKKSNNEEIKKPTDTKAFDLHFEEIDRLAADDAELQVEAVPDSEIKEYKQDKLSKIPAWVKALFIKFWFNGMVCYFFLWGLGLYITNVLDQILVLAIAMGIITDVLVNNILRFFDDDENFTSWGLFTKKKYWTLFANLLYAIILMVFVVFTYYGFNNAINVINGATGEIPFGVEPFSFAALYLLYDLIFVGFKKLIKKIINDANKKISQQEKNK